MDATEAVRARGAGVAARAVDAAFFLFGGIAAIWLAYVLLRESFSLGWGELWFSFLWWVLLAYLVLPRVQQILTRIYVPNYFIGRARTSDGLLGDPINIALLGNDTQIHTAMRAAGWTRADDLTARTGWRIVRDTLARRSYPQAPVSPLLLFERRQDFAYQQQVGSSPGARHHVRFWRCHEGWKLPGGRAVDWLAAGSYDRSVGLSLFTLQVTHHIAASTDAERDHVVQSVVAAAPEVTVGVIEDFSAGYHARNGGGDAIETDGNLPVMDVSRVVTARGGAARGGTQPGEAQAGEAQPDDTQRGETPVAERAESASPRHPPAPIVVGTALMAARLLIVLGLAVAVQLGIAGAGAGVPVVSGFLLLVAALDVVLAVLVYRGHNAARVVVMSLASVAIVGQALRLGVDQPEVTLGATLSGLSVDVLLVLALSSVRAREYAHHMAEHRVRRRAERRAGRRAHRDARKGPNGRRKSPAQ